MRHQFFFMFFVWIVDRAVVAQRQSESRYQVIRTPERVPVGPVPLCDPVRGRCYTFGYSPAGDPAVEAIVRGILAN
eukprot:SAG22_NODE_13026_length_421_cov_0.804348_1_plen_75_part_10